MPFVTRWSGETGPVSPLVMRQDGKGIRYADERAEDRVDGVLWARIPWRPGKGTPEWGMVHGLRQRMAMSRLLCQVCGNAADRDADGVLWLVDADHDALHPRVERTFHPPACVPCARRSVRACGHLRTGWTALRVRSSVMYGVRGALFAPGPSGPVVTHIDTFQFGNPFLPWVRAGQLLAELRDFTVVQL